MPTGDVGESVPGYGGVLAVELKVEQGTLPVAVAELVADVPAQRPELLPLLRHTNTVRDNKDPDLPA